MTAETARLNSLDHLEWIPLDGFLPRPPRLGRTEEMAGTPKADPRANPAARPPPVRPPERTRGGAEQNLGIRPGPPRSAHGDPARDLGPPNGSGREGGCPGPPASSGR